MQKTGIEWAHFVANPVKGKCTVGCPYCYAAKFYDRFKKPPFDDPTIRYDLTAFYGIEKIRKPSRIFVGSTIDLFCDEIEEHWLGLIMYQAKKNPKHTFIFLTKRPERMRKILGKWEPIKNVWLGVTVTNQQDADERIPILLDIPAAVRFVSVEPLLGKTLLPNMIDWVIVGGLSPHPVHQRSWVDDIVQWNNKPLFLKSNLKYDMEIRQFPEGVK